MIFFTYGKRAMKKQILLRVLCKKFVNFVYWYEKLEIWGLPISIYKMDKMVDSHLHDDKEFKSLETAIL